MALLNTDALKAVGAADWLIEECQSKAPKTVVPQPDANGEFSNPGAGAKFMASLGIPQVPLSSPTDTKWANPGKNPAINGKGWEAKASTDFAQIDAWAKQFPGCNFGSLATAKKGGHFVFEVDSKEPRAKFQKETGCDFTAKLTIKSSADDRGHRWYKQSAASLQLRNIGQEDADGFSLRWNNQQAVSPGSVHVKTGKQYCVRTNGAPDTASELEIAWWKSQIKSASKEAKKTLDSGIIPDGARNATLTSIAGKCRNLGMSIEEMQEYVLKVNSEKCTPPLSTDEVLTICNSVARYSQGDPANEIVLIGHTPVGEAKERSTSSLLSPEQTAAALTALQAEKAAAKKAKDATVGSFFYNPNDEIVPRIWVHKDFNAMGSKVVWVGTEKAEKSLFALRKAMHEACGKDWMSYKSMGPVSVAYFDAENPINDIDDRYNEILGEFTPEEQALIGKNLFIFKGRQHTQETGEHFDYLNETFWNSYADECKRRGVVSYYFDCLYMFHSIEARDNEGLKKVVETLHSYVGLDKAFVILHHTHKESDENLGKTKKTALRMIGARAWSNKIYGGGHVKKMADAIVCQERFEVREGSEVVEHFIDLAVFSRIAPDSVLLSFDDDPDYKYRRIQVVTLSMRSSDTLAELKRAGGPWTSKYAAAQCLSVSKRMGYERIADLISKGYLIEGADGGLVLRSGAGEGCKAADEAKLAEMTAEHSKTAKKWIREILGTGAVPVSELKALITAKGYSWESMKKNRAAYGVLSVEKDGRQVWIVKQSVRAE